MVGTITTLGWGGKSIRLGVAFVVINVLVSAAAGLVLVLIAMPLPTEAVMYCAIVVLAVLTALLVRWGRLPYRNWPRQLPQRWIGRDRPTQTTLRFGAAWGLAFSTPIRSGSLVILPILLMALQSPLLAAGAFGLMGLVRASPTLLASRSILDERLAGFATWHRPLVGSLDALLLAMASGVILKSITA